MNVGERIRVARDAAGLTQQALADRLGVTRSAVAQWETREQVLPHQRNLISLVEVLGVNHEWLATGHGPMHAGVAEEAASYDGNAVTGDAARLLERFSRMPEKKRRALLTLLEDE